MTLLDILNHWPIVVVTLIMLSYLIIESASHSYYLSKIPIRIHVNGTRGKSNLTRLIAAGLRQGKLNTYAKTTGPVPRLIDSAGKESAFYRPAGANLLEQMRAIKIIARHRPDAMVIECMAVSPLLQSFSELRLVRATHGVITQALLTPLDMAESEQLEAAQIYAGTTPVKKCLYIAETPHLSIFKAAAADRKTRLIILPETEINALDHNVMSRFCYTETKENVALALRVCANLGIPRETALQGMWSAQPDLSALAIYPIHNEQGQLLFVNAFAAQDPEATEKLWHQFIRQYPDYKQRIALINCRDDRRYRSRALAAACATWEPVDRYVVMGTGTAVFIQTAKAQGIPADALMDAGGWSVEKIADYLWAANQTNASLILGIGNLSGMGAITAEYFRDLL
jgi:poly-gamma-glutamate synthase PgsB/CapB